MSPKSSETLTILTESFARKEGEWVADVRILPGKSVNGTIVSRAFEGVDALVRRQQVDEALSPLGLHASFFTLVTPDEASALELVANAATIDLLPGSMPRTWLDLSTAIASAETHAERQRTSERPRIVTFYSYKGGVGRTTAVAHVAHELARRGRKVVLVDMDLEAPGLHRLFDVPTPARIGLVEYLYKLAWGGQQNDVPITDVFGEVRFKSEARGRLFLVPAGTVDAEYISRVTTLHIEDVAAEHGPWDRFIDAIRQQLEPDVVLIDSRTGINGWAAFALFRIPDEVFVVFQPNAQNLEGIRELLHGMSLLGLGERVHLMASLVPTTDQGSSKAEAALKELDALLTRQSPQGEQENEPKEREIIVPYNPHAALLDQVPAPGIEQYYMAASNIVDEVNDEVNLVTLLHRHDRAQVVKSFRFEEVRAEQMDAKRLRDIFQRTADFGKLLDGPTCLVRGRKGTGKSVLYWLFIKHQDLVKELAGTRLQDKNYVFISGHGEASTLKPKTDELRAFDPLVHADQWDVIWRAIVLMRLKSCVGPKAPKDVDKEVWQVLSSLAPADEQWGHAHNKAVTQLVQMHLKAKYALRAFDRLLAGNNQEVWLFFDGLDEDLRTDREFRKRVLAGLFTLIQTSDSEGFKAIRFKILLREDLWGELNFQNKSHFDGRYITLQWRKEDVLRLALRQAKASSGEFDDILRRLRPIADIDAADEATLYGALEPLWGIRVGRLKSKFVYRWIYERLSDVQGNFFPRSMQHLLLEAQKKELEYLQTPNIQTKHDRLIRFDALVHGLKVGASPKRVEQLEEEYPDLTSFLSFLKGRKSPLLRSEVRELWEKAGNPYGVSPSECVGWLTSIGLLRQGDTPEQIKLAEIYLYGLGMYRDGGP